MHYQGWTNITTDKQSNNTLSSTVNSSVQESATVPFTRFFLIVVASIP